MNRGREVFSLVLGLALIVCLFLSVVAFIVGALAWIWTEQIVWAKVALTGLVLAVASGAAASQISAP